MTRPNKLPNKRVLVLIRHAHRDKSRGRKLDNGLSPKGKRQAAALKRYIKASYGDADNALLVSSPKKRCLQTIAPLSGKKVHILELLDEGGRLDKKVTEFIAWWRQQGPTLIVACSHGDWIPVALKKLTGARVVLKKGALAEVVLEGAKPPLLNCLLQKL